MGTEQKQYLEIGELLPAKPYALVIGQSDEDTWTCRYEEQPGYYEKNRIPLFLRTVAAWLTDTRQDFLSTPTIENLVSPGVKLEPDITVQSEFAAFMSDLAGEKFYPSLLSTHRGEIWLFWPTQCMPLATLFSGDAKAIRQTVAS